MVPLPPSVFSPVTTPRSSRRLWRLTRPAPPTALAELLPVNPPPSPPAPSGVTMITLPLTLVLPVSPSPRRGAATCPRATTRPPSRMGRPWPFPPAAPPSRALTCPLPACRQTAKLLTSLGALLHLPLPLPLVGLSSTTFPPLLLLPTVPSSPPESPSPPPSTRARRPPCSTRSTTTATCQPRPWPSAGSSRSRMPPSLSNFASPPPGPS